MSSTSKYSLLSDSQITELLEALVKTIEFTQDFMEKNNLPVLGDSEISDNFFSMYDDINLLTIESYQRDIITSDEYFQARVACEHIKTIKKIHDEMQQ